MRILKILYEMRKQGGTCMYKVAICEDEKIQVEECLRYFKLYQDRVDIKFNIDVYKSSEDFLKSEYEDYDVIVLDVLMDKLNGVELAKIIRKKSTLCRIIFITAMEKYWPEGFKLSASRYILKPLKKEEFFEGISAVITELKNQKKCVTLNCEDKIIKVPLSNIYYLEIYNRKVAIHSDGGVYYSKTSMKKWGSTLSPHGFAHTHNSYLVNMKYIRSLDKEKVILLNGEEIYISKRKYREFKDAFTRYMGEIL